MHFLNCYHPVKISRYGEDHYVPCGHCDYCKYVRNQQMTQRLQLEMKHYKYALFITLTYANTFVPKMIYNKDMNMLYVDNDEFLHGSEDAGLFIDGQTICKDDHKIINRMMHKYGYVPYLRKSDLQLFTKRLRRNIDYYIVQRLLNHGKIQEKDLEKFRIYYSYCGEYGPTNLRPHYHGILFFDSDILARSISSLLRKSWQFGRISCRFCSSPLDAAYISNYVNATYRLPEFLQRRPFCPFRLFSKDHPVGLPEINAEEIQRIFKRCSPTMFITDYRGKQIQIPLWKSLENKLFPRFVAYNQIPFELRKQLIEDALKFDKFNDYYLNYFNLDITEIGDPYGSARYVSSINKFFFIVCKGIKLRDKNNRIKSSSLYSIYHAASIIRSNMNKFGVDSVADYLRKIDTYFFNCEQYKLKNQFEFENSFYYAHPDWLQFIDIGRWSLNDILKNTTDMQEIMGKITFSIENSHKNRSKHEYEALHPNRSRNIFYNDGSFNGLVNY